MGGKGVFVKEVQAAVLDGRADLAVHSAKDLPAVTHDDLVHRPACPAAAMPATPSSARRSTALAPGRAWWPPGSVRRRAQLAWLRPDLTFAGLRGNIDTRLRQGRRVRRHRHGRGRARPARAAPTAVAEVLEPVGHAAPGRPGRPGRRVPGRRRPSWAGAARVASTHEPQPATPSTPSGASWPSWAATATCRPAPTPPCPIRTASIALEGLLASLDGHVVLRHRARRRRALDRGEPADARPVGRPPPARRRRRSRTARPDRRGQQPRRVAVVRPVVGTSAAAYVLSYDCQLPRLSLPACRSSRGGRGGGDARVWPTRPTGASHGGSATVTRSSTPSWCWSSPARSSRTWRRSPRWPACPSGRSSGTSRAARR